MFGRALRDQRGAALGWGAVMFFYAVLIAAAFPTMAKVKALAEFTQNLPPLFRAFLGEEVLSYTSFEGFLSLEFFSMTQLLLAFFGALVGSAIIANELDKKTIEVLLAQPVRRRDVVWQKYLVLVIYMVAIAAAAFVGLIATAAWVGVRFNARPLALAMFGDVVVGIFFSSVFLVVSCVMADRQKAMILSSGVVLITYIIRIVSALTEKISFLASVSPFHYVDASRIIAHDSLAGTPLLQLAALSLAIAVGAVWYFERRDIAV